jgi:iron complex outermembrane recepter protein
MKYLIIIISVFFTTSNCFSQSNNSTLYNSDEFEDVNDTVKNKKGEVLHEVLVTAKQQKNPINIGKMSIKPMDLPQATAIISNTVLLNQQTNSLSDILKNANGVYVMGTTGGFQEEIASRGFPLSSSNTFKNGIRFFNGMPIQTSGLEKVELLKGSAAILFGNVSAGGILNLITKKPKLESGGEIGFRLGSFNSYKPTLDLYGKIAKSEQIAYRINASYDQGESFRDFVNFKSYYLNPSLMIKFSEKTQLLLEGDFNKDKRTADFGAGIINYKLISFPRNRFVGVSWGYFESQQTSITTTLNHKINENWNVNFVQSFRVFKTDLFSNTRPNTGTQSAPAAPGNGWVQQNGDWFRSAQRAESDDTYTIQQLDLKGNFEIFKIKHQLLIGADSEQFKTLTTAYKNKNYDKINIFNNYNPVNEAPIPTLDKNTLTTAPISRFGIYAQDLISFSEKLKLLAGLRYSYQDTRSEVLSYSNLAVTKISNFDSAFSPRLGFIYQPTPNYSIFTSYSNSFDINTGQDDFGNALKPSIIDQFEIGVKNKFFDERLFLNITAYQITNDSFYQQSLNNGNSYSYVKVLTGGVRSQGIELDIISNPFKGLSVLAGYSFNETKYLNDIYFIKESELKYNPKNTANFNVNYIFESGKLKGLNLGIITNYIGIRYAGRPTRIQVVNDTRQLTYVPDYFQVDATIGYIYKNWNLRTKISNVFDVLNYNIHDDNSVNPIAPQNFAATLSYKF